MPRIASVTRLPVPATHEEQLKAERWRARFVGALQVERLPGRLHADLVEGIEDRSWTHLTDERGKPFRSFAHFCRSPQPFGLEAEVTEVQRFLDALLGRRRAKLLLVPPARQGTRPAPGEPVAPGGHKSRHDTRLRAIVARAPDAVRKLYEAGVLTAKETETFTKVAPTPEQKAVTRRFTQRASTILKTLGDRPTEEAISAARERARRALAEVRFEPRNDIVYSAHVGYTSEAFAQLLHLHVPVGSRIADVTFGNGLMWQGITGYEVLGTDIQDGVDLRDLPYDDASVDAVVLDPPYQGPHSGRTTALSHGLHARYKQQVARTQQALVRMYVDGATEALRVLRAKGTLIIKCQDQVDGTRNRLTHVDIVNEYERLGLRCEDLFVVVQRGKPPVTGVWKTQRHARKNHSYLLVFRRA